MISQELINQHLEQLPPSKPVHKDKHNGTKFIHLKKEFWLNVHEDWDAQSSFDGKTFNGKDHMTVNILDVYSPEFKKKIKFDAATVAYRPNSAGTHMDVTLTFKNPRDQYNKRIGANITGVALADEQQRYTDRGVVFEQFTETEGFNNVFIKSIPKEEFLLDVFDAVHNQNCIKFEDIKTYRINEVITKHVLMFLVGDM